MSWLLLALTFLLDLWPPIIADSQDYFIVIGLRYIHFPFNYPIFKCLCFLKCLSELLNFFSKINRVSYTISQKPYLVHYILALGCKNFSHT